MAFQRAPISASPEFRDLEPEPWDGVLIWLLMPFVVLYNLATQPFATRRHYGPSRRNLLRPLTPDEEAILPPSVVWYLSRAEDAARQLGFREAIRHASDQRAMKDLPVESGRTSALTIVPGLNQEDLFLAAASDVAGRFRMNGATFNTRMTDGLLIVTGNERRLVPSGRVPNHDAVAFPDAVDIADLYRIHRKRVSIAVERGRMPIPVGWHAPATHPFELMQRSADEAIAEGIRRGIVEPPSSDTVRLTFKGAIRLTVQNTGALAPYFDARARRRARRVLRAIGM